MKKKANLAAVNSNFSPHSLLYIVAYKEQDKDNCGMKRVWYLLTLAIAVFPVATVGCQAGVDGQKEVEIHWAPIHEVQVNVAESFPE